jgi:hypothetical protein
MNELISAQSVEKAFLFIAAAGPLFGIVVGALLGARERRVLPRLLAGGLIGGLGTLLYAVWHGYNAVTNALGLDSLANLGLQMVGFGILGAVVGIVAFGIADYLRKMPTRG